MINEELYRKAAAELESEQRRPHIWARACALANDDQDEARYLYTNFRVEELTLEEKRKEANRVDGAASGSDSDELSLNQLELEPVDGEASDETVSNAHLNADDTLRPTVNRGLLKPDSTGATELADADIDDTLDLSQYADDQSVVADALPVGLHQQPADEPDDEPADVLPGEDDLSEDGLFEDSAVAQMQVLDSTGSGSLSPFEEDLPEVTRDERITGDDHATSAPAAGGLDDLGWLDDEYRAERRSLEKSSPIADLPASHSDTFTREFERQADDLPGAVTRGSVIVQSALPHEPALTHDPVVHENAGQEEDAWHDDSALQADIVSASGSTATDDHAEIAGDLSGDPPGRPDSPLTAATFADDSTANASSSEGAQSDESEFEESVVDENKVIAPLDLADTRGRTEYAVYQRGDRPSQAVRQGVSWTAMLLTLPWLLTRGLLGTAFVYALFAVVVVVGLLTTGLAWFDAGTSASLATKAATVGFALLALIGLWFLPFLRANTWREDKLENKGYELAAYVRSRSPRGAIDTFERALHD